jgi:hypothetical protein
MALTRAKASQVTAKLNATGSTVRGLDDKLAEFVSVKDFGAVGDGVADDTAAINNALAAALGKPVLLTGVHLVSSPIRLARDQTLMGQSRGDYTDGVGVPTWPATYPSNAAVLVGSHTTGPVVSFEGFNTQIKNITVSSTEARYNAAITTAFRNINCGILCESAEDANQNHLTLEDVFVERQPADGVYICGDNGRVSINRVTAVNCQRHGIAADNGQYSDRVSKTRPGMITIVDSGAINIGGHGLLIGHTSSGTNVPYRVNIVNWESFRCGNVPAHLLGSSGAYVLGEQVTVTGSAASGTTGYSGNTAGLDYAWAFGGRQIKLIGTRFVNSLKHGAILASPWGGIDSHLDVDGCHFSTNATAPQYALDLLGQVNLSMKNLSGNYTIDELNPALITSTASTVQTYENGLLKLRGAAGLVIARSAVTAPTAEDGNVFSGTYTPTLTDATNVTSSTASVMHYLRVGDVVTVSGQVTAAATVGGSAITLGISLPIASDIGLQGHLGGVGAANSGLIPALIRGNAASDRADLVASPTFTSSYVYFVTFSYRVI